MFNRIAMWLIMRAMRTPYSHLHHDDGSIYMHRYWLVPFPEEGEPYGIQGCYVALWWRNPLVWLLQKFDIAVRVHHIATPDVDRHLHDHPWDFISIVLRGWYVEQRPQYTDLFFGWPDDAIELTHGAFRKEGSIAYRRTTDRHSISSMSEDGVWTLFITFKYQQGWGFFTQEGKVPYREYLATRGDKNA